MAGIIHKLAVVSVLLGLSAGAWAQATPPKAPKTAAAGKMRKPAKTPKPSAAQPAAPMQVQATPPQPVAPTRPDQMPPTAPQVTYQNGQLSIVAQNSTLSSILAAVRARTGAQVEMPVDTANDRVAVKLGPGNPRDVLSSLLHGSRFDYIVLGSAADPTAVSQVILTPHQGGSATAAVAAAGQPGGVMSGGQSQRTAEPIRGGAGRPEINAEEEEPAAEVLPQPAPSPQAEPAGPGGGMPPGMQGAPGPEQPQSAAPGQQNPNQPKTPEQLLQELQRMQQLQQQQQQQQRRPQPPQQ